VRRRNYIQIRWDHVHEFRGLDDRGSIGFDSRRGLGIFLLTTASRPALRPIEPPTQWARGAFSLGVKRPRREADHSPPSSAEFKEWVELYLHSPGTSSWRGAQLKHRDNFTFYMNSKLQVYQISYDGEIMTVRLSYNMFHLHNYFNGFGGCTKTWRANFISLHIGPL
jgi:hypothetical protein